MPNGHMRQWLPREKSCVYYSVDDPDETEPLFNFGKYRGKSLKKVYSIPAGKGYIQWILRQSFEAKGGTLLDNKAFTQPCLIDPDLIEALEMVVNEETYEKVSYKSGLWEDLTPDEKRKQAANMRRQIRRLEREELGMTREEYRDKRQLDRFSIREDLDWS